MQENHNLQVISSRVLTSVIVSVWAAENHGHCSQAAWQACLSWVIHTLFSAANMILRKTMMQTHNKTFLNFTISNYCELSAIYPMMSYLINSIILIFKITVHYLLEKINYTENMLSKDFKNWSLNTEFH